MLLRSILMDIFGKNFEHKINKMIEKYGKRKMPIMKPSPDQDDEEDIDDRYYEYYFHYDKRKEESFSIKDFQLPLSNKQEYYIIFFDTEIADGIRKVTNNPEMFKDPPEIDIEDLYCCIQILRAKQNKVIKRVLHFVEELFKDKYNKMDSMINSGMIDFQSLWYYLDKVNTIYVIKHLEEDICFKYKYFTNIDDCNGGKSLLLTGNIIVPYNSTLNVSELRYDIKKFPGTKKINTLKITPLQEKSKYIDHGEKVLRLYGNIKHMHLNGKHYIKTEKSDYIAHERNERVIIDYEGMVRYNGLPFDFDLKKTIENLAEEDKIIMYPFVCTYNLGIGKTWGLAHIKNLVDVVYQKDAFDRLVLEPEKKKIIKSLILYKSDKFKDFIETKGNGLIFLLYGAPGTGKTLSAEATCELLEKPMYCLNVGDLGIDPEHMEIIMNTVFEYSKRWDAIICIDEVDIFLEERENNMIARNAMVGIFLKLLEYHNGIIFLTTNRLTSLDPAIKSRINLMISYKDLTSERRVTIWKSLCQKWCIDISEKTFKMLGEYKLNGREIRNYIKIIIAIHEESKEKITDQSIIKELDNCLDLSKEFDVSVNSSRIYT